MLGEAVYQVFAEKCQVLATDIDLNESWLSLLDVRNKDEVTKVCEAFKLKRETYHTCTDLIDRYLSNINSLVHKNRLQLIGVTALYIASKIEVCMCVFYAQTTLSKIGIEVNQSSYKSLR